MKKLVLILLLNSFAYIAISQPCEVFREDFNGSTTFTDSIFPYGKPPSTCLWAAGGKSVNRATEQWMSLFGYTDFEIKREKLNFPKDNYVIMCKWRDSVNSTTKEDCSITNLDDAFGASCVTPNRIWAINGQMVHQHPGPPNKKTKTFFAKYSGPINKIEIAMNGGCSVYSYDMWIDYIAIVGSAKLPKIKISYSILDSGRVQFVDSSTEVDANPPTWNFSNGFKSTELSPIVQFDTSGGKSYYVCLTRSNTCATDSICIPIDFNKVTDSTGDTTGNGISIHSLAKNKFIDIKYNSERKVLSLKNKSMEQSQYVISDINGKRIISETLSGRANGEIDFSNYTKGFYVISYYNKTKYSSEKLLIY